MPKKLDRTGYNRSLCHCCPISQAILVAPLDDPLNTASLSLANRSIVMFEKRKYTSCLMDIRQCLDSGYPHRLRHKLYFR